MITNKAIIDKVLPALVADTALEEYCQATFSKSPIFFVGLDTDNPPDQADTPYISIIPNTKDVGNGELDYEFNFFFDVVITGSDKPVKTGNTIVYDGLYMAEELALHVQRVVTAATCGLDTKVFYIQAEIRTFPVYAGIIALTISSPNVIGSDEITIGG